MIALGIRYLLGRAAAAGVSSYEGAEWPPHPGRVFMALAAAHFETRDDPPQPEELVEREALEWLAMQPPPEIWCSTAEIPEVVTSFVPPNDVEIGSRLRAATASPKAVADALRVVPGRRLRKERTFPRAIPDDDTVWLVWPTAEPSPEFRSALERVASSVTRIGHSSSLVQVWVADAPGVPPNLVPVGERPIERLRIPVPGLVAELEAAYREGRRPALSRWQGYARPADDVSSHETIFDDRLLVVRVEPDETRFPRLPLTATAQVVDFFRRAVLSAAEEPIPEFLSGHGPDGSPSEQPHVAFVPLPFVGRRHADGHLLGLALALPRALSRQERRSCERALGRLTSGPGEPGKLVMGRLGRWRLVLEMSQSPPVTLRPETWTRPSAAWASVTPVVLDRYTHDEREKEEVIAAACERIGLPRPAEVRLTPIAALEGVPPAFTFGPLRTGRGPVRPFTHAVLFFKDADGRPLEVRGPVLIGAGRYRGYGLFRPLTV